MLRYLAAALAIATFTPLASAAYLYQTLVPSDSGPFTSFNAPALNNSGTIAFSARPSTGGSGVYRMTAGSTLDNVFSTGSSFTSVSAFVALNNHDTVAFTAGGSFDVGTTLFTSAGGTGSSSSLYTSGQMGLTLDSTAGAPSINDSGVVAFKADLNGVTGVYKGKGGALTTIVAEYSNGTTGLAIFNSVPYAPTINNNGQVAALVGDEDFVTHSTITKIVVSDGGPALSTIVDDTGTFAYPSTPLINDSGNVLFEAGPQSGPGSYLGEGDGTSSATVLESLSGLPTPAFNNDDDYAYVEHQNSVYKLIVVHAGTSETLLTTGDALGDKIIKTMLIGPWGLNDSDALALRVGFDDGTSAIVLATPDSVPEPASLALLTLAAGALLRRRRA